MIEAIFVSVKRKYAKESTQNVFVNRIHKKLEWGKPRTKKKLKKPRENEFAKKHTVVKNQTTKMHCKEPSAIPQKGVLEKEKGHPSRVKKKCFEPTTRGSRTRRRN